MYLFASRSGLIESDQGNPERHSPRARTAPIDGEPYAEVLVQTDSGFTAEEEAFFAEGDLLDLEDDDDLLD